jgi:hypothetical protein
VCGQAKLESIAEGRLKTTLKDIAESRFRSSQQTRLQAALTPF